MLGKQNRQTSFMDIETWYGGPIVTPESIYGLLDSWGDRLITDEDFAELFSATGRPSVSPALLSKVLLLMYHENVSDREAQERAQYDLRWKVALRLSINEAGFDYTALCRFRARLLINKQQKLVFERFLRLAKEAGIVKDGSLQIIDSSHILGAGAVQDTYMLIKTAIQKLLKVRKKNQPHKSDLVFQLDYSQKGKPDIDWDNEDVRQQVLQRLVEDSHMVLAAVTSMDHTKEEQLAAELLATITEQDIDISPEGTVTLRHGVAKDRVISAEDTEMRHGHKTSRGKFNGYKGQIMMDEASEIITNVEVTPGNQADGEVLNEMLTGTTVKPGMIIGDTAYGTLSARESAEDHKVVPVAPLPMGSADPSDPFSKYQFHIDWETMTCTCPFEQSTTKTYKDQKTGIVKAFVFDKAQCSRCPFRSQCFGKGKRRTVFMHPQEQKRRDIMEQTNTPEFKGLYRNRSKIERKVAHVMNRGMRKSRYIGREKTLTQLAYKAAGVNLKRIFQCIKGDVSKLDSLRRALGI